ncbi:MAG: polymorphic toxin type 44 domain-containing protein, partial [Christensenella sp.]
TMQTMRKDTKDFPNYTEQLTKYVENVVDACKWDAQHPEKVPIFSWIEKVRPGGSWDPKSNKKEVSNILGIPKNEISDAFYFNGQLTTWEEFGNFLYGVSGSKVGFSSEALASGSAVIQYFSDIVSDVKHPKIGEAYRIKKRQQKENEAKDQNVIERGIEFYNKHYGQQE